MGFFRKMRGLFHDDWCPKCAKEMNLQEKQLFMLNETVSHYVQHKDAKYFQDNLIKVNQKSDIPAGMFACGIKTYWCLSCNKKIVQLVVFLPVRDQEKYEDMVYFENGEMDAFLESNR